MIEPKDGALSHARSPAMSRCRKRWLVMAASICLSLTATIFIPTPPFLLWNASTSLPEGLYRVAWRREFARGDLVVAPIPPTLRKLAASRDYLPAGVPLLKPVAAIAGDHVCARGERIWINESVVASRLSRDRRNRPLPWWQGCRRLGSDDVFLLVAAKPGSFDGRYFGVTAKSDIIGRARALWTTR